MLPWSAVSHPSRASHDSSYHTLNLIINQSSSSTPYLVLPSSKIELKVKKKNQNIGGSEISDKNSFSIFANLASEELTPPLTLCPGYGMCTQAETCYWAFPRQLWSWQTFFWPFLWSKCAWHDGRTYVMTQKMVSQCFNFIEDWFAIFYF